MSGGDDVKVGIIGFGRIGAEHAGWLNAAVGITPAAVFDPTPARLATAQGRGLSVVTSIEQLLDDDTIEAVLVSTPTAMHFDHASMALRAGKHVMVEKPMAIDAEQARGFIDLADQQKRVLSVFQNRRWDIDYLTIAQAVRGGVLGKVINVESRIGQWSSCVGPAAREWRPNWRNEAAFGGGGLFDWGSHFVDQVWRMMLPANPVRVFAQLRGNVWSSDCDDFARVCIDFDNGAVAMVEINTTTTRPLPRWHVDGTLGSVDSPFSLRFDLETWAKFTFTPADGSASRPLDRAASGLTETQIWEHFAGALRGRGEVAVPARSVLPTMILLDAARESSRIGGAVEVPILQ